jgi:hypothetical protein
VSDPLAAGVPHRPGARTPEGLERCRKATWKHGRRSAEVITGQRLRGQARRIAADLCALIREAEAACAAQGAGSQHQGGEQTADLTPAHYRERLYGCEAKSFGVGGTRAV